MQVIGNISGPSVGLVGEDGKETVVRADALTVMIDGRKTELGDVLRGDRVIKTRFLNGHLNYLELERDEKRATHTSLCDNHKWVAVPEGGPIDEGGICEKCGIYATSGQFSE